MYSSPRRAPYTAFRVGSLTPARMWLIGNGALLIALLVGIFTIRVDGTSVRVKQVSGDTIVAQRTVSYPDRVLTAAAKRKAAADVIPVYKVDTSTAHERGREAASFFQAAIPIVSSSQSDATKLTLVRHLVPNGLPAGELQQVAVLGPRALQFVAGKSLSLLTQAQAWRFTSDQVTSYEAALLSTISPRVPARQRTSIGEVLSVFLEPTLVLDKPATERKQAQAEAAVRTAISTVYAGQVVVRRGDIVTPSVMQQLTALGLQSRHTSFQDVEGSLLFAALTVIFMFWYLGAFYAPVLRNTRFVLLIDAIIVFGVLGARLLAENHVLLPFFLPVAAVSTFAAALMLPEACVAVTVAMAVLAGWVAANSFELMMYYFLTGTAGILAIRRVQRLKQFIWAGFCIFGAALTTLLAFGLVDRVYDFTAIEGYVAAAAFNGFVSSAMALGAFALLSSFFGVTTALQLLELSQPNQPVLRQLMVKAPGTYNHSLILANMVEHAAEEIGANSLVAKLGALYHDIGKSVNPHCFVENQLGIGNIHDDLPPLESARIIRGHVSAGIRMARQHRLPAIIRDAIAEHHGTMTVAYFLKKEQQLNPEAPVDVSLFQYAGPRPQSKETALLMLADACESAVRASRDHSNASITDIVGRIFQERVSSGQLDCSPLTLQDIRLSQAPFCSVLNGLYHPRIEYPETGAGPLEIESETFDSETPLEPRNVGLAR